LVDLLKKLRPKIWANFLTLNIAPKTKCCRQKGEIAPNPVTLRQTFFASSAEKKTSFIQKVSDMKRKSAGADPTPS
jgi:hypothetical protein